MAEYCEKEMIKKHILEEYPLLERDRLRRTLDDIPAADAIEELTAYVRQIEELRKDGYYLQKTKMMTYGQATMTQPLPEPPKGE